MRYFKRLLFLALIFLYACSRDEGQPAKSYQVESKRLSPLPVASVRPPLDERWPIFFFAEGGDSFLWGGARKLVRVTELESGRAVRDMESPELTRGLDRLIAASRGSEGALALLDASGQIVIHRLSPRQIWRIHVQLPSQAGALAITKGLVYVLLRGELNEGAAVAAYTFTGRQAGQWGRMPPGALIQANLSGGGIAACKNGEVFYSYINDSQISRLEADGSVRPVGKPPVSFETIAPRQVRRAYEESLETRSVAPLVRAGLGASRVMMLLCSQEGLLLRQVAQPHKKGSYIEIWEPVSEELLGVIPVGRSVLLDVRDQTLYLGTSSEQQMLTLERIRYRVNFRRVGG